MTKNELSLVASLKALTYMFPEDPERWISFFITPNEAFSGELPINLFYADHGDVVLEYLTSQLNL